MRSGWPVRSFAAACGYVWGDCVSYLRLPPYVRGLLPILYRLTSCTGRDKIAK